MSVVSMERRLRKVEAARGRGGYAMFTAWGRTAAEARQALEDGKARGAVRPGDEAMPLVWPHADPVPRSRWISFGRKGEDDLSDRELETMVDQINADLTRREREAAVAAGEDMSGLDDTDFLIRAIRREGRDATLSLRLLEGEQNPRPEVHWPETNNRGAAVAHCNCVRCQAGETMPNEAFRRYEARRKAWRARYLPGEEMFA